MGVRLIKFEASRSKLECCLARTVPPSSPVEKLRRLLPQRWEPAMTCSAWKDSKAKPRSVSCFTTTSRHFRLEKLPSCVAPDGAKLVTAHWQSARFRRCFLPRTNGLMPCALSLTCSTPTVSLLVTRFAEVHY